MDFPEGMIGLFAGGLPNVYPDQDRKKSEPYPRQRKCSLPVQWQKADSTLLQQQPLRLVIG